MRGRRREEGEGRKCIGRRRRGRRPFASIKGWTCWVVVLVCESVVKARVVQIHRSECEFPLSFSFFRFVLTLC